MKKYILLSCFVCALSAPGAGQAELPPAKEVEKEYRPEYRRAVREYNRVEKRLETEGWDFYLDPIETVPTDIIVAEEARLLAYTNWYRDIASPESLAGDMVKGARRKGVILVTDTACDSAHPDLQKGKLPGSTYAGTPCGNDVHGHGTHTWGIAALICKPLVDAGWIEVKPVQFLGDQGQGSLAAITAGVDNETAWAEQNYISAGKFALANASWGSNTTIYGPLKTALEKSKAAGVAWVFAAGNTGGPVIFPGLLEAVLAVSSLDNNLAISSFSCRGPEIDLAAGGRGIYSTYLNGSYASLSGTSMAAPAVAGAGAVAMCVWPALTAETLPGYLAKIAKDLGEAGKDILYGDGAVFVRAILDTPPEGTEPPPSCTDGKQNGNETGVDCGGPDCPPCPSCTDGKQNGGETGVDCGGPCPPCGPVKPPYKKTRRLITMSGKFIINWYPVEESGASALSSGGANAWDGPGRGLRASALARVPILVTEIGFWVDSESTYEWEYDALEANVKRYFRNVSIGTPETWDGHDRGRYIPYFLAWRAAIGSPGFVRQELVPAVLRYEMQGRLYDIAAKDLPVYVK